MLALGIVALTAAMLGSFLHRWLWRHMPKLAGAPMPAMVVDLGAGIATAVLVTAAVATERAGWSGLAYSFFAIVAVQLSVIDWRLRILPNILVLPSGLIGLVLLVASAAFEDRWDDLVRALTGAVLLFLLYLVLALVSPKSLGMGDVKLAGIVGLYLAFQGWTSLLLGAATGFLLGALIGVALLSARRAGPKSMIPFGPSILTGAALVLFLMHGSVLR